MATVDLGRKGRDIKAPATRGAATATQSRRSAAKPAKLARMSGGSGPGAQSRAAFLSRRDQPV
jgi:hypothetical protein